MAWQAAMAAWIWNGPVLPQRKARSWSAAPAAICDLFHNVRSCSSSVTRSAAPSRCAGPRASWSSIIAGSLARDWGSGRLTAGGHVDVVPAV
jgi:hypothetical protein